LTTTTTQPPDDYFSIEVVPSIPAGTALFEGKPFYRVQYEAVSAVNLPTAVFVHRRSGSPPNHNDQFVRIAGPKDLIELPTNVADADGYIRLSTADFLIESITLLKETDTIIKLNLQQLVSGLKALSSLNPQSSFVIES
jgi:hypothetical protein